MTHSDLWHYPRTELAKQVLGLFEIGLSTALIFFAPRRMGKTEFLQKYIYPLAEKQGWKVLYFSFLDVGANAREEFIYALTHFVEYIGVTKKNPLFKNIHKISGQAMGLKAGIELRPQQPSSLNIKELLQTLAQKNKILLLLDEVQSLCDDKANEQFISTLRTALDITKDSVKVIFTGSSQEGLRLMFSRAKAPFFHFGQNLPFPQLDRNFTDHLIKIFEKAARRKLDHEKLWKIFIEMEKVPLLVRSLVERLILNPNLSLDAAKEQLLLQIYDDRAFANVWRECSALEQLLLTEIIMKSSALFSENIRKSLAEQLGIEKISPSTIQSSLKKLQTKNIIGRMDERGIYYIIDPNFKRWLASIRL